MFFIIYFSKKSLNIFLIKQLLTWIYFRLLLLVNTFWLSGGAGACQWIYFDWWWVVLGGGGYTLAGDGCWWMVVNIFWLMVGGGGYILASGGWWLVVGGGIVQPKPINNTNFLIDPESLDNKSDCSIDAWRWSLSNPILHGVLET